MTPEEINLAKVRAFDQAYSFTLNEHLCKAAGYSNVGAYIKAKRNELEKEMQRWERENPK